MPGPLSWRARLHRVLPWRDWRFAPWLRYTLTWKGFRADLPRNPDPMSLDRAAWAEWRLHRCADGAQCRSNKGGGCATGYCAYHGVTPDETGVPRFPRQYPFLCLRRRAKRG